MAKKKKLSKGLVVLIIILVALFAVALYMYPTETRQLANEYLGIEIPEFGDTQSPTSTQTPTATSVPAGGTTVSDADPDGILQVHFIDVGQGDGIFIEFPDGETMLIDAGHYYSSSTNEVLDYLEEQEVDIIDYFMITHSDADHIGAVDEIVELYDIVNFYLPKTTTANHTTATYATALASVDIEMEDGVTYVYYSMVGMSIEGEDWVIDFYMPVESLYEDAGDGEWDSHEKNSVSPIIVLSYAGRKVMFTGDSNEDNEEIFVEMYAGVDYLDVDVLKVAHHGSREGSTAEFLEIVLPEYAVISAGADNTYGHPHEEAVERLDFGTGVDGYDGGEVYTTIDYGDIVLTITGTGEMSFEFQKS